MSSNSRKNGFYNSVQAKVFAQTYYEMGKEQYIRILNSGKIQEGKIEEIWKLCPIVMNLTFACEIMLKLFYERDNGKMAIGHKLKVDLYDKLSDDSQKAICDTMILSMNNSNDEKYSKEKFLEDFQKSENAFVNERYAFEIIPGKAHGLQVDFTVKLAETLLFLYKDIE